jgi:uncharacterized short protein YbdD (DUF466 family)
MRSAIIRLCHGCLTKAWRGLREWCGDAAYERYAESMSRRPGSERVLTPAEFYVEQMNRRYSRPNRCC